VAVDDEDQLHVVYQDLSGASAVATYSATTSGKAPVLLSTIEGTATNLTWTFGLAISRHHYTWVTDQNAPTPGLWVFAPGLSGNVKPTGTISGSNTRMTSPFAIGFDSYENPYVVNPGTNSILRFTASQSGNVAPVGQITGPKTQLNGPTGILVY